MTLYLFEDVLADGAALSLPPLNRFLYVVAGEVAVGERRLQADGGSVETGPISLCAGGAGATIWRWELTASGASVASETGEGWRSGEKLSALLTNLPDGPLLIRGDSVAFPANGCALRHVHQGPGIRCLVEGTIRIDTHGHSTSYGPGGAWFEAGPEPVFAAVGDRPARFVRCMVLPIGLLGKSSIRYVEEADRDRPKDQRYRPYGEAPLTVL